MSKSIEATSERTDYVIPRTRQHALAPVYWNAALQTSLMVAELYGKKLSVEYNFFSDGMMNTVIPRKDWESVGNYIASRMISEPEYFEKLSLETERAKREILAFLEDSGGGETIEALGYEAKQIQDLFFSYDAASVFAWFVAGDLFHREVSRILALSEEDFDSISMPEEESYASEMEQKTLEYALSDSDDIDHLAEILTKKYYWIPFGYDGPEIWNAGHFKKKLYNLRLDSKMTKRKLESMKENAEKLRKRKNVIESTFHDNSENMRLIRTVRALARWTDERKMLEYQLFVRYRKILEKIGELSGMSIEVLKFLFTEELPSSTSDISKLTDLAKRRMAEEFMTVSRGGETRVAGRKEMDQIRHLIVLSNTSGVVSGVVASRGPSVRYIARVKILHSAKDGDKVEDGDLLVTFMTTPDYVLPMTRAVGFITDEGGVTCHAAIVAREMNKLCIIGTKIATKVLKDGDLVEVDADRGVVRILEKKVDDRNAIVPSQQKIRVEDWQPTITRNMSFWHQYTSARAYSIYTKDFGIDIAPCFLAVTKDAVHTTLFVSKKDSEHYPAAVMDSLCSENKVRMLRERYERFADDFTRALDRLNKDVDEVSWDEFVRQYERYSVSLPITTMIGREGTKRLQNRLSELGKIESDVPRIIAIVTYPNDWTPLLRSRLDLLEIGKKIQGDELPKDRVETLLQAWLDNHRHIPVNFCEEPWTEEDARKQLDEVLESNCAAELDRLRKEQAEKQAEKERILKEIDDEAVSTLAYAIAEGTYLNEFRKNVFSRVSLGYRGIFSRVAEMAGSDNWRDCFYLTPEEMRDIISGSEVGIEAKKRERQIVGYVPDDDGSLRFLSEEEANAFSDFLDSLHGGKSEEKREVTEIPGFIANTGKVRGTVRVILSSKDFDKMETGDILVTAMTSVDFVPIMERAGAFVTNEGGITSHAAIVSREMGKPCVIGTKIATKVLHDGDLVEVDADRGVVRIIDSDQ